MDRNYGTRGAPIENGKANRKIRRPQTGNVDTHTLGAQLLGNNKAIGF